MRKLLILMMMILAALNVPAQRFQAMVGNGYGEQKGHGDLTYRFLELRWLPFLRNEQECKLGFFGNLTQVSSKIDGYVFNSLEKTIGLTLEYCPSSYSYYTDVYSWINVGYKFSEDSGGININNAAYRSRQKDEMIFIFAGLVFNDKLNRPFYIKKFYAVYQNPIATTGKATWQTNEVTGGFWNKEYFSFAAESSIFSILLTPSGSLKLDPTIAVSYSHEAGNNKDYYDYYLKAIFRRDIGNQELLTLSGGFRTSIGLHPMLRLEMLVNLAEVGRFLKR